MGPYAAASRDYLAKGWSPLPLPSGEKAPVPEGFTGAEGRDPTEEEVEAWVVQRGDGNVGLRLPPGVVGIDVDCYGGKKGCQTLAALEEKHGPLPPTVMTTARRDGSGIRFYRIPEDLHTKGDLGPGIEVIQRVHRYAVAPPSVHPSTGRPYRAIWTGDGSFTELPPPEELPELPEAWLPVLQGAKPAEKAALAEEEIDRLAGTWATEGAACRAVQGVLAEATVALVSGEGRHPAVLRDQLRLLRAGERGHPGVRRALATLREAFKGATVTSGGRDVAAEWSRAMRGAVRIVAADPTLEEEKGCRCETEEEDEAPEEEERTHTLFADPEAAEYVEFTKSGRAKFLPGRFAHARLLKRSTWATLEDTGEILRYNPERGVYEPGEAAIRAEVGAVMGELATDHGTKEVMGHVQRASYVPRDAFNPPKLLCLENGVLDLGTLELEAHGPNPRFTRQLPVAFDPEATCPAFLQALEEMHPDEGARGIVQQLFGYTLEAGNWLQRAFMCTGGGNNGKSTLLAVLKALLGPEGVSALTLQQLATDQYAASNLFGKLANICADLPNAPVRYTGIFKAVTGGDPITANRKYRDHQTFVNEAVLIFSANELPTVDDRTYAFYRRWTLIPFEVDFTGREDRRILDRLTTPEELSGILNWTLEGLRELRGEGDFPADGAAGDLMEEWKRRSDSVYWFVEEAVEWDPDEWTIKADLYQVYRDFCEARDLPARPQETFHKAIPDHLPKARAGRVPRSVASSRPYAWYGITVRQRVDQFDQFDRSGVEEDGGGQGGQGGQGGSLLFSSIRTALREKGPLSAGDLAREIGEDQEDVERWLAHLRDNGEVEERDGLWRWTGR